MDLSQVSIGVKTFLRDAKLLNTIAAISRTMPEVTMIIADCGDHSEEKDGIYADMAREGHTILQMPFDAGFGAMSNAIAGALKTEYLLIGSDDFDFNPPSVRKGIEELASVLDATDIDIASGRLRGPYEFTLEDLGDTIIEHRVETLTSPPRPWYIECDLTVNYSLIKKRVFEKVSWDNEVKIGGCEHGMFFLDVKRAGFKVAYVPGVQISEQQGEDSERYKQFRSRANSRSRPCCDSRGIRKYVLGTGQVDYEKVDYPEPHTR